MSRMVISVQANLGYAQVKPQRGGRSQNYMPPEAADAIQRAQAASASAVTAASAIAVPNK